jgi:predicted xylose isomerase-like sugar epimerase
MHFRTMNRKQADQYRFIAGLINTAKKKGFAKVTLRENGMNPNDVAAHMEKAGLAVVVNGFDLMIAKLH